MICITEILKKFTFLTKIFKKFHSFCIVFLVNIYYAMERKVGLQQMTEVPTKIDYWGFRGSPTSIVLSFRIYLGISTLDAEANSA